MATYLLLAQLQGVFGCLDQQQSAGSGKLHQVVLLVQHVHVLIPQADDREGRMELGLCCQLLSAGTSQKRQLTVAPPLTVPTLQKSTRPLKMASS